MFKADSFTYEELKPFVDVAEFVVNGRPKAGRLVGEIDVVRKVVTDSGLTVALHYEWCLGMPYSITVTLLDSSNRFELPRQRQSLVLHLARVIAE